MVQAKEEFSGGSTTERQQERRYQVAQGEDMRAPKRDLKGQE